jgi:hypothetical protein
MCAAQHYCIRYSIMPNRWYYQSMVTPSDERRLAANEVVFRRYNESVQQRLDELSKIAKSEDNSSLTDNADIPIHFHCECSNEKCKERVILTLQKYKDCHKRRDHFVLRPGHEVEEIEHVIANKGDYCIVEKYADPPETASKLHQTNLS